MATFHPYLNFNGNTEEAFTFYKSVIGGEFAYFQRNNEAPGSEHLSAEEGNKIMHVALPLGGGTVMMGTDVNSNMPPVIMGTNFYISIAPENEEEAHKLFNGLSAGGIVTMPLQKQFWGDTFGMFTDKFGVQWMMNYNDEKHQ